MLARDKGKVKIAFQMPLYPMIDRTEEDLAAFEERTAKLIDFYDGITVFGNYENMRR